MQAAVAESAAPPTQSLLDAFEGPIAPVKQSAAYRFGIFLVAVVMVLLPLIYLAIIGLVGYGIYYHAINHTEIIGAGGSGRARGMSVLVYIAPIIAGAILVVFMFKPLFSRPARRPKHRSLKRSDEPLLFDFVDRICVTVGAPRPREIRVDCEVNASASFRRGWLSLLGHDLVLTIGTPLVAGLSLRQFAGVLAHEFGHFSQGAGMRLTYIIRSISAWFTRVVYERDAWDQKLVDWSNGIDVRIGFIFYLARFFVWLTRKVLWVLMVVGHAVSGYMLRQMEFDADRYEARLAGSETFESTARQLAVLAIATRGAHSDLGEFYREGRLGDDLPQLILANVSQFTPETHAQIDQMIEKQTTGWFDTHPCDTERVASARREDAPGVFHVESPASVLFRDFSDVSQQTTWDFYYDIFGDALNREDLHPVAELLERQNREQESIKALRRYFQAQYTQLRKWALPTWQIDPPDDADECVARLKDARQQLMDAVPQYAAASKTFSTTIEEIFTAERATALLNAGMRIDHKKANSPVTSLDEAQEYREAARRKQVELAVELDPFEMAAGQRLFAALQLLQTRVIAQELATVDAWQADCVKIIPALEELTNQLDAFLELRTQRSALEVLLQNLEGREDNKTYIQAVLKSMETVAGTVQSLRERFEEQEYPLDHAKQGISIGEYLLSELPDPQNPGALHHAAGSMFETATILIARLMGRLCHIAEHIETHVGLPPLPEPAEAAEEDPVDQPTT